MSARLEHAVAHEPARRPGRPQPAPERRPPLRVVRAERDAATRARRRARLAAIATVLIVGAGLFGVVALHVVLTQNQFRLDRVEQQAEAEQSRYERLRLNVAQLESPDRIVATAQQRLGMVAPPDVRYLTPQAPAPGAAAAPGKAGGAASASAPAHADGSAHQPSGWAVVKPQLAPRR